MEWLAADGLSSARWLLTRLIGALYALAFANAAVQWRGLLGDDGLLPVRAILPRVRAARKPTIFAWRYDDSVAIAVCWTAAAVAGLLTVGVIQQGPAWLNVLVWLVLWGLYLSVVHVGQIWYAFGWETILLEAGFLAALLGPDHLVPSWAAILLLRWLLFRVELGAGLIKWRGDRCWRDLTCTRYHHETQPIPGPLSWWAHTRPLWWHKVEVAGNHVTQLVIPFALFAPQPVAGAAAVAIILTQGWLVVTGNFSWLNVMTIILAVAAIGDPWLAWVPADSGAAQPLPTWFAILTLAAAVLTVVLSWWPVRNMLSANQAMNIGFNRFHLVGSYGAFGTVTRTRIELVVEGTMAEAPDAWDAVWLPYRFKAKPGDPARRPPQVAPWHLRLDWLMWFAALMGRGAHHDRWLRRLVAALLQGNQHVSGLLQADPFDGHPPRWIRITRHRYRFTTPAERRETGRFWNASEEGVHLSPVSRESAARW